MDWPFSNKTRADEEQMTAAQDPVEVSIPVQPESKEVQSMASQEVIPDNQVSNEVGNDGVQNDCNEENIQHGEEISKSEILEPSSSSNNADVLEQIANVEESVDGLKDSLENVLLNVQQLVRNQASANDVAAMRRENEAFRSDSNMKLMRAYGIDAMIKTYQGICEQIFRLNHLSEDDNLADVAGEKKAYEWVLKTMGRQFKRLEIRLQTSEIGDAVNEEFMTVFGSEGEDVDEVLTMVQTDNESLKDTVKESVSPAFIWTIPSLIGEKKEWVMEPEKICMYK